MDGPSVRLKSALIAIFLLGQLWLPIPGLLADKFETRGNFSWNMYSQRYRCSVRYRRIEVDGRTSPVNLRSSFRRPEKSLHVLHKDRLPAVHRFLCDEIRGTGGQGLMADVVCKLNGDPEQPLTYAGSDVCDRSDLGVRP